ncbi:methyltransferase domain-containing protein [Paracoccus sp. SCSIO 75233]|uniref:methyltransferase domain-containing protein n=1 Tax=Paracoccus sp. SCSIO 75233 TaxID=3017782 RepID=UPI0022EFEF71|nr:methyltransferase domain-containing protein [Paracoccus sp. SCSIO 75233]WBU53471.1 SAM-dependent methyltransferase [Paracoccus sp. SCSIO 75233]
MSPETPITAAQVNRLIDRPALIQRRDRARGFGVADPLHRIAADEIEDRLAEINRRFTRVGLVTGWPELWQGWFPDAIAVPDTEVLDLPGDLDLVIHAMSLHWAEDPVGQIVQCARALKPDGLFIAVCFGGDTLNELRDVLTRAEIDTTGGLSPRLLPMGELRDMGGLLSRAGLALPVADHLTLPASYRDLFHLIRDLRAMGETNALAARPRHATRREIFDRAAADYATRYPDPDDPSRIRATFDLIFLTGWAPDPSQQQPLRPGSAKLPLADVLKTRT